MRAQGRPADWSSAQLVKVIRDTINNYPMRAAKSATIDTVTVGTTLSTPELVVDGATQPKITSGPLGNGPPTDAGDGDIWIATNVDANGTVWQFRHNLESDSAYQWEFIGGSNLRSYKTGTFTGQGNSAWVAPSTAGYPALTIPRAGDYAVGLYAYWNNSANGTANNLGAGKSGAPIAFTNFQVNSGAGVTAYASAYDEKDTIVTSAGAYAANDTIIFMINCASAFSANDPQIWIRPIRIA